MRPATARVKRAAPEGAQRLPRARHLTLVRSPPPEEPTKPEWSTATIVLLVLAAVIGSLTVLGLTCIYAENRVGGINFFLPTVTGASTLPSPRTHQGIDLPPVGLASDCRDARNTLTAVFENGVELGRYDYDRNLIRIRRTTKDENVEYVLDEKHVLNEVDASGNSIRRYHYGTKVLAVTESAGTSYVLNDGIGSASDFWSSSGTLAKSRQYDAWGNFRNGTAPAAGEAKVAYTGHQFDPETGWVYAKARYYDSGLGVFLSRDSWEGLIGNAPTLHRYAYALRNPLRYWDPSGNGPCGNGPGSHTEACPQVLRALGELSEADAKRAIAEAKAREAARALARAAEEAKDAAEMAKMAKPGLLKRIGAGTAAAAMSIGQAFGYGAEQRQREEAERKRWLAEYEKRLRQEAEDAHRRAAGEPVEIKEPTDGQQAPRVDPLKPGAAPMQEEPQGQGKIDLPAAQPNPAPRGDPSTGQAPMQAGGPKPYKSLDDWIDARVNPADPAKVPEAPPGWDWEGLLGGWEEQKREKRELDERLRDVFPPGTKKVYGFGRNLVGDEVEVHWFEDPEGNVYAPKPKRVNGESVEPEEGEQ